MDPRFFLPCFHGPRALLAVRTSHSANKRYVMDSLVVLDFSFDCEDCKLCLL